MDAVQLAQIIEADRIEWRLLTAELDAAAGAPSLRREWNSRAVYAHLARWLAHSTADIESLLAGGDMAPLEGGDDEINARWHTEDQRVSFEQARASAHEAFERRLQVLEAAPEDRLDAPALERAIRADGAEHYRAHRRR